MPFNLRENLYLKVFAFLVAVVCWIAVRSEEERVKDFTVPVEFVNLGPSFEMSGKVIDTVAVRLRAPEPILSTITEDRLAASIDLSRVLPGEQHIQLTAGMIRVPGDAEVVRILPEVTTLRIEKRIRREVPVVAEFAGKPPRGYEMARHVIEPPVVTIVGPASEVAAVGRAMTGTIVLEGETQDLDLELRPVPDAPPGSRVRILAPQSPVHVHVAIQRAS